MLHRDSRSAAVQSINDRQEHAVNEAVVMCNVSGMTMLKKSGRPQPHPALTEEEWQALASS